MEKPSCCLPAGRRFGEASPIATPVTAKAGMGAEADVVWLQGGRSYAGTDRVLIPGDGEERRDARAAPFGIDRRAVSQPASPLRGRRRLRHRGRAIRLVLRFPGRAVAKISLVRSHPIKRPETSPQASRGLSRTGRPAIEPRSGGPGRAGWSRGTDSPAPARTVDDPADS